MTIIDTARKLLQTHADNFLIAGSHSDDGRNILTLWGHGIVAIQNGDRDSIAGRLINDSPIGACFLGDGDRDTLQYLVTHIPNVLLSWEADSLLTRSLMHGDEPAV